MKNHSFATDFRQSLELLVPYVVLAAVIIAAVTSTGSWTYFFDKTLPRGLGLMAALWVVMGLYFASVRRRGGVAGGSGYGDDGDDESLPLTNPATGLMMNGGLDSSGSPMGTNLFDND